MVGQSQVQRRLSQPEGVERVRRLLVEKPDLTRTGLAGSLCDEFEFLDRRGRPQRGGCLKALRVLEARGHFTLPPPLSRHGAPQPRRLEARVPAAQDVPGAVGEVRGLKLVQTGAKSLGSHLHSTLVVTDDALPLGVLRSQCRTPAVPPEQEERPPGGLSTRQKKTCDWLLGLRDCEAVAAEMPHTRVNCLARDADDLAGKGGSRPPPRGALL